MLTTRGNLSKLHNLPSTFFKNTEVGITSNPTSQFLLVCSLNIRHRFVSLSKLALWHNVLRLHSEAHSMSDRDVISVTSNAFVDILNVLWRTKRCEELLDETQLSRFKIIQSLNDALVTLDIVIRYISYRSVELFNFICVLLHLLSGFFSVENF
jgi:hypothetical protein